MKNELSFKELIKSNIDTHQYHISLVQADVQPRFAYTIGLYDLLNIELVFSGGIYYFRDQIFQIFNKVVSELKNNNGALNQRITVDNLGEFTFLQVDYSWSKLMLLGVFDRYGDKKDLNVFQIIPDTSHFTYDIPDMSRPWNESEEPVWQWLTRDWDYNVAKNSTVITNIEALQGGVITELMRWETDEWEMFAGPGPDVEKEDTRVVPLATIIGIDDTLLPAIDLEISKGLWRINKDAEWNDWG